MRQTRGAIFTGVMAIAAGGLAAIHIQGIELGAQLIGLLGGWHDDVHLECGVAGGVGVAA